MKSNQYIQILDFHSICGFILWTSQLWRHALVWWVKTDVSTDIMPPIPGRSSFFCSEGTTTCHNPDNQIWKAVKFSLSLSYAVTEKLSDKYASNVGDRRSVFRLQQPLFVQSKNISFSFICFTSCDERNSQKIKQI